MPEPDMMPRTSLMGRKAVVRSIPDAPCSASCAQPVQMWHRTMHAMRSEAGRGVAAVGRPLGIGAAAEEGHGKGRLDLVPKAGHDVKEQRVAPARPVVQPHSAPSSVLSVRRSGRSLRIRPGRRIRPAACPPSVGVPAELAELPGADLQDAVRIQAEPRLGETSLHAFWILDPIKRRAIARPRGRVCKILFAIANVIEFWPAGGGVFGTGGDLYPIEISASPQGFPPGAIVGM